ncbi:hypothetical protein N7471_011188 [Penicillium samsonianum]|uniref:uncharacterized protein n=1 Tax=Penicillium samsonianum TaxID=1882272 RepID=UPI002548E4C1|nr:uncharacterized protein N7471_011188 [Penicillium samsonianum]KAJ6123871.1 hypothetical protein N7471_011188 [Penicillium samsonianum]
MAYKTFHSIRSGFSLTIHMIRKYLRSVVKENHGSTLVSQIYGYKDTGTYPKDLGYFRRKKQSHYIEYFQGIKKFYKCGLLGELPAEIEASIL